MEHLQVNLSNIHCDDCEFTVRQTVSGIFALVDFESAPTEQQLHGLSPNSVFYRLHDSVLDLYYHNKESLDFSRLQHSIKSIIGALSKKGFVTSAWSFEQDGRPVLGSNLAHEKRTSASAVSEALGLWARYKQNKLKKHHIEYCKFCQAQNEKDMDSDASVDTLVTRADSEFRAVFSISGMSCASCVGSISQTINSVLTQQNVPKGEDPLYSVDLLQHSAVVLIPNKQLVNKIIDAVNDAGFTCQLVEVLPVIRSINQKATAVIGGMTCAACVNAILSAVSELPFVLDSGINLVTKSGQFVLESSDDGSDANLEKLKETIEDCGFDFELIKKEKINFTSSKKQSRNINIAVDGMFCANCPNIIMSYLSSYGEAVVIEDPVTLDQPFVKFTYIPNIEKGIQLRRFLADLNHLQPLDNSDQYRVDSTKEGMFKCHLVEKVSIDEHLRKMARKDTLVIVRKLIIATVFAIPSFIFGIIGMSLLPKHNAFRAWVEKPLWAGNVSRVMWILFFLSTPVYFFAADIFHTKAIKELRSLWLHKNSFKKRFFKFGSMSLLMSLGTTVAYFASIVLLALSAKQPASSMGFHTTYFDSVVFLSFFLLIGRLLESIAKSKTADAVSNLSSMKALEATVVERVEKNDAHTYINDQVIDVKLLESGDYIRISTGESPPVDCVLVEGSTEFDESALTGESDPVKHHPGHQVFSGTVNVGNNSTIAKILSVDGDSLIDQIVSTVRDGQMRKAPIQRAADVLTGYFVPVIVALAIITWVIWLALAYSGSLPDSYLDIDVGGWTVWSLEFAIAVFVVACPCGIGLAAPTALFVGSGLAAKHGVLAKGGGTAFQDAAKTNLVCFDKTGTLTYGKLKVTDFAFVSSHENDSERKEAIKRIGLQVARDLELASKHPIATAVKDYILLVAELSSNIVPHIETVPGKGVKGQLVLPSDEGFWTKYQPTEAILGNEALLRDCEVIVSEAHQNLLNTWKRDRKSVVTVAAKCSSLFGDERFHLVSMIACRDEVRLESKPVIKYLEDKGIECWMITGDNKLTADAIAEELGINADRVISEVLPDEKQAKVSMLQRQGNKTVAMVGDGINDAPALATADVGIALSSGADLAVTSSDFILLNRTHPIVSLCTLLDLSQVVFRRVKFNFAWSLVYNMIGIPIAAGVIYPYNNLRLSPVWASAAMALSSISVFSSSLLLRLYTPKIRAVAFKANEAEIVTVEVSEV